MRRLVNVLDVVLDGDVAPKVRAAARVALLRSLEPCGDPVLEMDNLLTYIDGISDERDSVPLLLAVRTQWPRVKATIAALTAERVRSTPADPGTQVPFSEG